MSEYFLAEVSKMFGDAKAPTIEDNVRWIQAFPYNTWTHPIYGETTVTPQIAEQYVKNFKDNVRGQDIATNFDHGEDKSKGNKASGWIKDVEARQDGLFIKVAFTPTAVEELKNGEWRYFSSECFDTWTNPMDQKEYQHVLVGGALTNKPWVKDMLPINFSEVLTEKDLEEVEKQLQFKDWSESYVESLPDSAFLYIESGGKKDSEDKMTPRSLRYLPYKDSSGKVDTAQLRNATVRIPQMVALSESLKNSLEARAKRMLAGMEKTSEIIDANPEFAKAFSVLEAAGLTVVDESKEWEHSEPGSGSPPAPRTDGDGHDEKDREEGWRRPDLPATFPDTLVPSSTTFAESSATAALKTAIGKVKSYLEKAPADFNKAEAQLWLADAESLLAKDIGEVGYSDVRYALSCVPYTAKYSTDTEGGTYMGELTEKDVQKLMTFFEVDDEGKLVEAAQVKFGELQELQRANAVKDQEHKFAEEYPEMWDEHNKLMQQTRESEANAFSESVAKVRRQDGFALKDTRQGLTTKAKTDIAGLHKKFSEKSATVEDFEEVIKSIVNGGIIEFGERGTNNGGSGDGDTDVPSFDATAAGIAGSRQMFGELVQKEINSHSAEWAELPYNEQLLKAGEEVAKKHPDLAENYRRTTSA